MEIYHLKRKDSAGWCEYCDFVVIAESMNIALDMPPAYNYTKELINWDTSPSYQDRSSWVSEKSLIDIVHLGSANAEFTERCVICENMRSI